MSEYCRLANFSHTRQNEEYDLFSATFQCVVCTIVLMASKIIEAGGPLLQRYSKIASYHVATGFLILITTWMTLWQATMMEVDTAGAQSGAQPPLRRVDGRGNDQLRPPGIELGPNNRADGSARVSHVSPSYGSLNCFYDLEQKSLRYRECRCYQGNTAD